MKTQKRRRREGKTDYLKRFKLLKSRKPRIVFRKTNKYIIVQYVSGEQAKDRVKLGVTSGKLLKYGWPKEATGSLKSIPASYLTGFLIGKKIKKENLEEPVFDIGMHKNLYKTKVYAFLKGLADAGVEIKYKEEILPAEEKIKGKDMKNKIPFDEIKSKIEKEN